MKLLGLCFSDVWMLCCCFLVCVKGHNVCQQKFISSISLSSELQSEILLPCLFEVALFGSNLTTSSSAVWTQINTTVQYIVEVKVNDLASFWNNRDDRIKTFSDRSVSGNFSIMISNVQRSDLGLYRCELFRDDNCSLGYREIRLTLVEFSPLNNWKLIVAGGGGGGFLLLCLITVCLLRTKRQTVNASVEHGSHNCHDSDGETVDEITYASVVHKSHKCLDSKGETVDEITYASVAHKSKKYPDSEVLVNNKPSASEYVSSETVLYATVKKRDKT